MSLPGHGKLCHHYHNHHYRHLHHCHHLLFPSQSSILQDWIFVDLLITTVHIFYFEAFYPFVTLYQSSWFGLSLKFYHFSKVRPTSPSAIDQRTLQKPNYGQGYPDQLWIFTPSSFLSFLFSLPLPPLSLPASLLLFLLTLSLSSFSSSYLKWS